MPSVVVIGTGNVARHLCAAWSDHSDIRLIQIIGRTIPDKPVIKGMPVTLIKDIDPDADCYIFAVSDAAISTVNQSVSLGDKLVLHTSGSVDMDVLKPYMHRGVFYPLQTFSSGRTIDLSSIPIFLETNLEGDKQLLQRLASSISGNIHWIDSPTRRQLHLSAIYINNFTNHLLYLSRERCRELDLDPGVLNPLLQETIAKAIAMGPYEAQTGPARRGDSMVIESHLDMIGDPIQQEIYNIISQSIQSTYENELQKLAE